MRSFREELLDRFFEIEKKIMIKYYHEKQKKIKKYKSYVLNLQSMDKGSANKKMILKHYYRNHIVQKNLEEAVWYCASLRKARDEANEDTDKPDYGQLTDLEASNLKKLAGNVKKSQDFIYKGTKADKAVGTREKEEEKSSKKSRNSLIPKDTTIVVSGDKEEEKGMEMDEEMDDNPLEKSTAAAKKLEKKQSPSKTSTSKGKGGKKGGKKSKAGPSIDRQIPDNRPKP